MAAVSLNSDRDRARRSAVTWLWTLHDLLDSPARSRSTAIDTWAKRRSGLKRIQRDSRAPQLIELAADRHGRR
jgi:hypothetical protein